MDQADDVPDVGAWQQLPEESAKAYHTFYFYLHAGAYRSLRNVASVLAERILGARPGSFDMFDELWGGYLEDYLIQASVKTQTKKVM